MSKDLIFDCGDHKIEFQFENFVHNGFNYFFWDEVHDMDFIQVPEYDGWRLPTSSEMQYLIDNYMCRYGYCNSVKDSEQACIFDDRLVLPNKGKNMGCCGGGIWLLYYSAMYWVYNDSRKSTSIYDLSSYLCATHNGNLHIEEYRPFLYEPSTAFPIRLCRTVKEETNNTNNINKMNNTEQKELNIVVPEGYTIDKENSTFEKIVFKKVEEKPWRNRENTKVSGWWISEDSKIHYEPSIGYDRTCHNIFATRKQAKSAFAMAQISQIMAKDERFGGPITDEEWIDNSTKYAIIRYRSTIGFEQTWGFFYPLAFHTPEQRALFLKENEDLVKDYLMLD